MIVYLVAVVCGGGAADWCGVAVGCDGLSGGCCCEGQLLVVMGYLVAVVVWGAADCCDVAVGCDGLSGGCCCVGGS